MWEFVEEAPNEQKNVRFLAACTKSTENCGIMPIQDLGAPKTNARLPSLKPNFSITEQELCKDTPLQKISHGINFRLQIQNFGFFELISTTETEFRNFRVIFVIISVPKVSSLIFFKISVHSKEISGGIFSTYSWSFVAYS